MGCKCNQNSCSQNSCSSEHYQGCCSGEGCGCSCHKESTAECSSGSFAQTLLALADEAWMEVLKDKIKDEIIKNSGTNLTELARLVSSTNHKRWGAKMHAKQCCHDFDAQLKQVMGASCCSEKECSK